MLRKRKSTQKSNKEADQMIEENPQKTTPSITELPSAIFIDILVRLPVKSIIICKSVCKSWYHLVADPEFAKVHFAQAEVCTLVRTFDSTCVSRMLYLVEPESFHDFDLGECICDRSSNCDCRKKKLDTRLKIPLRNSEVLLNSENYVAKTIRPKHGSVKSKSYVLKPKVHNFKIVNSCNGLLCLSEPSLNDPMVVCNPITGEYINLPVAKRANEKDGCYDCGFGFDPMTKQYKVIVMFDIIDDLRGTQIHTLGTGLWKTIGSAPWSLYKLAFPTYLDGCLYWLSHRFEGSNIVSFNFGNEEFHSVPLPPLGHCGDFSRDLPSTMCMGVLRGCLCIFNYYGCGKIQIWVMKQSGDQQSWTKEFSIDAPPPYWWPYGLYQPISYSKNGALLMFHYPKSALISWGSETHERKYLKIQRLKSIFEAIAYIPSFISLKDAMMGDGVVVLNIKERCAKFKLQDETKAVIMEEVVKEREYSGVESYDVDFWDKHWWAKYFTRTWAFY